MVRRRKSGTEQQLVVDHLSVLTNAEIQRFLRHHRLDAPSSKKELRQAVKQGLKDEQLSVDDVVSFLDEVTPWGKQHVFLLKGPPQKLCNEWRDKKHVQALFAEHDLTELVDADTSRFVLPDSLELARIEWDKNRLRVVAIRKREGWVRDEDYDQETESTEGEPVQLRAFVFQALRGVIAFEWNLRANTAFLQITQLPTGGNYDQVAAEFRKKIYPWLDLDQFAAVDLPKAVKKLIEAEEKGKAPAESHAIDYGRAGSRRVHLRSTSTKVPLRGDALLDGVLKTLRPTSIPRIHDSYWSDGKLKSGTAKRHHVQIVADRNRVNFATPSNEGLIRHVLTELRTLSR